MNGASTSTAWTSARTLDALKRHFKLSDQKIADRSNGVYSRNTIEQRRRGVTALDANDFDVLGQILGVPSTVFLMDAGDAIRYVLDNNITPPTGPSGTPDVLKDQSGWTSTLGNVRYLRSLAIAN